MRPCGNESKEQLLAPNFRSGFIELVSILNSTLGEEGLESATRVFSSFPGTRGKVEIHKRQSYRNQESVLCEINNCKLLTRD